MFSRSEVKVIRHMLDSWEKPPICPHCESALDIRSGAAVKGCRMIHVRCRTCRRVAFLTESAGDKSSDHND